MNRILAMSLSLSLLGLVGCISNDLSNPQSATVTVPTTASSGNIQMAFHFLQDTTLAQNIDSAHCEIIGQDGNTTVHKFDLKDHGIVVALDSTVNKSKEIHVKVWDKNGKLWLSGQKAISDSLLNTTITIAGVSNQDSIVIYGSIQKKSTDTNSNTLIVQSTLPWQESSDSINAGQTICYSATGLWTANGSVAPYGPNGTGRPVSDIYALPGASEGALLARVNGQSPVVIGANGCITAQSAGRVYFAINDALSLTPLPQGDALADNSGFMTVIHSQGSSSSSILPSSSSSTFSSSSFISSSSQGIVIGSNKDSLIIQANLPWQNSSLNLKSGDSTCFSAYGLWTANGSVAPYGPAGTGRPTSNIYALPGASEGALLAKVGNGSVQFIGSGACIHADSSGIVSFAINDALSMDPIAQGAALSDNSGSVTVLWNK